MTTLRELQKTLLRELGKQLVRIGFGAPPKGQTFIQTMPLGSGAVHLSFIEHDSDFDVTVDVAVRFDEVEELVHRSNKLLSTREKSGTFTLGAELGNLERGEPHRWTVARPSDAEAAASGIVSKLELVGLPYIERYSRIEDAHQLLSRDDREAWIHSPIHSERAKRACAMLFVMERAADVEALASKKSEFLKSIGDPGLPLFEKFASQLAARPMGQS
jgi:hypothetical protein